MTRATPGGRRLRASAAAVLAAALVLGGCGDEDGDPQPGEGTTAPAPGEGTTAELPQPGEGTTAELPQPGEGTTADGPPGPSSDVELGAIGQAEDPRLGLASAGLVVFDGERLVDGLGFNTATATVVEAMTLISGETPPAEAVSPECPTAIDEQRTYADGLVLTFSQGGFRGWSLDTRADVADAPRTVGGIGLGSTFAELREDFPSAQRLDGSTLGEEFFTDAGYAGLLSGPGDDATITDLWSGDICIFR